MKSILFFVVISISIVTVLPVKLQQPSYNKLNQKPSEQLHNQHNFKEINLTTHISGKVLDTLIPIEKTKEKKRKELKHNTKVSKNSQR